MTPLWAGLGEPLLSSGIAIGPEVDGSHFIKPLTQHAYQIAQRPNRTFKTAIRSMTGQEYARALGRELTRRRRKE